MPRGVTFEGQDKPGTTGQVQGCVGSPVETGISHKKSGKEAGRTKQGWQN